MGCCASTPIYEGGQHGNASSRNPIISDQPQPNVARPSTAHSSQPQQQSHTNHEHKRAKDSKAKPDKKLRRLVWTSEDRTWTRREIDQEREDFFFTRVTGQVAVWQTIRTALEVLWAGGDPEDEDGGLETARAILTAASITLPHSTLDRGVYDVTGQLYELPKYVVSDPTNLVKDPVMGEDDKNDGVDKSDVSDEEDEEELQRRREEKGKGIADEQFELTAKRSDTEGRMTITAGKKETVRQVLRRFHQLSGLPSTKRIQLMYFGRELDSDKTLTEQDWQEGHVLSAFISDIPTQLSHRSTPKTPAKR